MFLIHYINCYYYYYSLSLPLSLFTQNMKHKLIKQTWCNHQETMGNNMKTMDAFKKHLNTSNSLWSANMFVLVIVLILVLIRVWAQPSVRADGSLGRKLKTPKPQPAIRPRGRMFSIISPVEKELRLSIITSLYMFYYISLFYSILQYWNISFSLIIKTGFREFLRGQISTHSIYD